MKENADSCGFMCGSYKLTKQTSVFLFKAQNVAFP